MCNERTHRALKAAKAEKVNAKATHNCEATSKHPNKWDKICLNTDTTHWIGLPFFEMKDSVLDSYYMRHHHRPIQANCLCTHVKYFIRLHNATDIANKR